MCILSGQRSQTLSYLSISNSQISKEKITFPIGGPLKQTRPGFHQKPLEFSKSTGDVRLCPYHNINCYIEKTKSLRGSEDNFFISYVSPHKAMSSKSMLGNIFFKGCWCGCQPIYCAQYSLCINIQGFESWGFNSGFWKGCWMVIRLGVS